MLEIRSNNDSKFYLEIFWKESIFQKLKQTTDLWSSDSQNAKEA